MIKILHQVWIQGAADLPQPFRDNRAAWRAALPDDWEMRLWDNAAACAQWADYAEVQATCSHHAMRADLILARALRDFGGLATGTDVIPKNIPNLLQWLECNETLVIANPPAKSASNGLVYMGRTGHPFICCVCRHQLRDRKRLRDPDVWRVTGPGCYWEALAAHQWDLAMATDLRAYSTVFRKPDTGNPLAWVDPGYAGSWHG